MNQRINWLLIGAACLLALAATGSISPRGVVLLWGTSTDPEGGSVTYTVYLDHTAPADTTVSVAQAETSYAAGDLDQNATYYWRVVAIDSVSATSSSAEWMFTTTDDMDYGEPADEATGVDPWEYLWWYPEANDSVYVVWFSTSDPPDSIVAVDYVTVFCQPYQKGGTLADSSLASNTTYYWKVVTYLGGAEAGDSLVGPVRSFTTRQNPAEDLLAYWKMEESGNDPRLDSSGRSDPQTMRQSSAIWDLALGLEQKQGHGSFAFPMSNSSYGLQRVADSLAIDMPGHQLPHALNGAFTIGFWYRPDSLDSSYRRLTNKDSTFTTWVRESNNGEVQIEFRDSTYAKQQYKWTNLYPSEPYQWHQFVARWDGTDSLTYWMDGVVAGVDPFTSLKGTPGQKLRIGSTAGAAIKGYIDDFWIYGRGLSNAEVESVYTKGTLDNFLMKYKRWIAMDEYRGPSYVYESNEPADMSAPGNVVAAAFFLPHGGSDGDPIWLTTSPAQLATELKKQEMGKRALNLNFPATQLWHMDIDDENLVEMRAPWDYVHHLEGPGTSVGNFSQWRDEFDAASGCCMGRLESPWYDGWVDTVSALMDTVYYEIGQNGASVDFVFIDIEDYMSLGHMRHYDHTGFDDSTECREWVDSTMADVRWPWFRTKLNLTADSLGYDTTAVNFDNIVDWWYWDADSLGFGKVWTWDYRMWVMQNDAIEDVYYETAKLYWPNVKFVNYYGRASTHETHTIAGALHGAGVKVPFAVVPGTHSSFSQYGGRRTKTYHMSNYNPPWKAYYWTDIQTPNTQFNTLQRSIRQIRGAIVQLPANDFAVWLSGPLYTPNIWMAASDSVADDKWSYEGIFHIAASGGTELLHWGHDPYGYPNGKGMLAISRALEECDRIFGVEPDSCVTQDAPDWWGDDLEDRRLLSGVYIENEDLTYYRYTPGEAGTIIDAADPFVFEFTSDSAKDTVLDASLIDTTGTVSDLGYWLVK